MSPGFRMESKFREKASKVKREDESWKNSQSSLQGEGSDTWRRKHRKIKVHSLLTAILDKLASLRLNFSYKRREGMTVPLYRIVVWNK